MTRREKIQSRFWFLNNQAYRDVPKWRNNRKTLFRYPAWAEGKDLRDPIERRMAGRAV